VRAREEKVSLNFFESNDPRGFSLHSKNAAKMVRFCIFSTPKGLKQAISHLRSSPSAARAPGGSFRGLGTADGGTDWKNFIKDFRPVPVNSAASRNFCTLWMQTI
jgi:hypothetical protein